jgi:hypothetical protein
VAIERLKGDEVRVDAYLGLLQYYLGPALRRALEAMMATREHKYISDFARKYYGEGKVEGEAKGKAKGLREAVLTVATARSIALSDADRTRVATCSDLATLESWLTRAAHAVTANDVFGD